MTRLLLCFLISFFIVTSITAQGDVRDTTEHDKVNYYLSGALITTGVILNRDKTKRGIRDWIRERHTVPQTDIDDIVQHAPIVMMYAGLWAYQKDKATIARHTRHLIVTQVITIASVHLMKTVFPFKRPSGGSRAFPSGHTAYAFANAGVMYQSFKDDNLWLAYSGYIPAIIAGTYRMLKDKHWVSDVLVGAGVGILVSQLTYKFDLWNSRTKKDKNVDKYATFKLGVGANGIGLAVEF